MIKIFEFPLITIYFFIYSTIGSGKFVLLADYVEKSCIKIKMM